MSCRKDPLSPDSIYHIFTKSISKFTTFNDDTEFSRMKRVLQYYQCNEHRPKFSTVTCSNNGEHFHKSGGKLIQIIAYCLMPTHLHLILKQLLDKGISKFMNNVLNSYTRYFNTKYHRKGPLWESRFKNIRITTDEQLIHLTRYIHLNPTTAYLVERPEDWKYSSYREYLQEEKNEKICDYDDMLSIDLKNYRKFVEDRIGYQRELAKIKRLIME